MPETFVPLVSATSASRQSAFASLNLKTPSAAAKATGETQPAAPAACATKPTVTLQRTGDIVSGIRVQCGCGQVVDLNCIY